VKLSLVVINGKHAGRIIRVKRSKFTIGRSRDCHLRPSSDRISRHHCVILVEEEGVLVRDLDSRNGTFVNGERIEGERPVEDGDRLGVGRLELEVRMTTEATATTGSLPPVAESQAPAEPTDPSTETFEALDMSDDDLELKDQPAGAPKSGEATADEPTQTLTLGNGQPAAAQPAQPEDAATPEAQKEGQTADHEVSEEEKEKNRKNKAIVGVSKATQAKRVTGTSSGAAAEALRKFFR